MRPVSNEKIENFLKHFPTGAKMVQVEAPPGLEEVVEPIVGIKVPGGPMEQEYFFFMEFANHEEWTDFKKNRMLILKMSNQVNPFFIGAFHEQEENGDYTQFQSPSNGSKPSQN